MVSRCRFLTFVEIRFSLCLLPPGVGHVVVKHPILKHFISSIKAQDYGDYVTWGKQSGATTFSE